MYKFNTYRAATTLWDLAYGKGLQEQINRPGFSLTGALDITSAGQQWIKAEEMHRRQPESPNPHLFATNELNTILSEVTGKRPGEFPAYLIGNNPFVKTEEGVAYVTVTSGHEDNHQVYAGITDKLIFLRVYQAQPNVEDFTKDVGEEQVHTDNVVLRYEFIVQYGDMGQVIAARGQYDTFQDDALQLFVMKVLSDVLLAHAFNSHQKEQIQTELKRFTQTVTQHLMVQGALEQAVQGLRDALKTAGGDGLRQAAHQFLEVTDIPAPVGVQPVVQSPEDVARTRLLGAYYRYFDVGMVDTPEAKELLKNAIKTYLGLPDE